MLGFNCPTIVLVAALQRYRFLNVAHGFFFSCAEARTTRQIGANRREGVCLSVVLKNDSNLHGLRTSPWTLPFSREAAPCPYP